MALVNIKLVYDYYTKKRVTPLFFSKEELLTMNYAEFKNRVINEVSHLKKIPAVKFNVIEDNMEIDISVNYFKEQMRRMLEKEKTITIKAFDFESPQTAKTAAHEERTATSFNARRSLYLPQSNLLNEAEKQQALKESHREDLPFLLPLQRYTKKQQETARVVERNLIKKREEVAHCKERIRQASIQNLGNSSVCGNCHLKLGHTKKKCEFSPCRSAYSCGLLAKHGSEKVALSSLEKDVARLERSLASAKSDIDNAERAAEKAINSVPKRIEDVVVSELPDRYMTLGRRNWSLLNKDVAMIQKQLQGKLPSRENVSAILNNMAFNTFPANGPTFIPATEMQRSTDHRMSSQKRLLSEDYAVRFPTQRYQQRSSTSLETNVSSSSEYVTLSCAEKEDFKLALALQREEIENSKEPQDENLQFEADAAAALLHLRKRDGCI